MNDFEQLDPSLKKAGAHLHVDERQFNEFQYTLVALQLRITCALLMVALIARGGYALFTDELTASVIVGQIPTLATLLILIWSWQHWFQVRWQFVIACVVIGFALYAFLWPILIDGRPILAAGGPRADAWRLLYFRTSTLDAILIILTGLLLPQLGPRAFIPAAISVVTIQMLALIHIGFEFDAGYDSHFIIGLLCLVPAGLASYALERSRRREFIYSKLLSRERQNAENLLSNILPRSSIDRLRQNAYPIADSHDTVGVLFADLVGFTEFAQSRSPQDVVRLLDRIFSEFDRVSKRLNIEKIKTIGDCYMGCTGVGNALGTPPKQLAIAALGMLDALSALNRELDLGLKLRCGINVGPAVAGVIGQKKLAYDLWGPTVNLASRMESTGEPGRIQVSEAAKIELDPWFEFSAPHMVSAKGLGNIRGYWLNAVK